MNYKRLVYLCCSCILWTLLSIIAHIIGLIEIYHRELPDGSLDMWYHDAPILPKISMMILGIGLGYVVGCRRWQIVYIEKRHWRSIWHKN